jgi:hypothetical protein
MICDSHVERVRYELVRVVSRSSISNGGIRLRTVGFRLAPLFIREQEPGPFGSSGPFSRVFV